MSEHRPGAEASDAESRVTVPSPTGSQVAEPPKADRPADEPAAESPAAESTAARSAPTSEPPIVLPVAQLPTSESPAPGQPGPWAQQAGVEQHVEWVDPSPTDPILRIPPPPLEPKSTAAAVLLNLTGLGAGYLYLRRRWRTRLAVVIAVALVVVAFATGAAANPWLWRGLAAGWLLILALDAVRIARRHPRPEGRRPVLIGAIAVAAVVCAYVGYGALGRDAYDDGLAAQTRGDCATATDEFDAVVGRYELTLSADVAAAGKGRIECAAYTAATDAQQKGEHQTAAHLFHKLRKDHPDSPMRPLIRERLIETYTTWARTLRDTDDLAGAITVYRDLLTEDESFGPEVADTYLRHAEQLTAPPTKAPEAAAALKVIESDFGDTPSAADLPAAYDALYAAATVPYANGRFCEAVQTLEFFSGLTGPIAAKVAGEAKNHFPRAMLECGLGELREGASAVAVGTLERFVGTFPGHGDLAQAQSALISAKVGVGTGQKVPVPAPLGVGGPNRITFYNSVNIPIVVRVAGATAHEFTMPACANCPPIYEKGRGDAEGCDSLDGLPSFTADLGQGTYHLLVEYEKRDSESLDESLDAGAPFDQYCLYLERG